VRVAEEKIAVGMRKFHPTEAEANPNYKFVRNRFAALLSEDPEFGRICQKRGLTWGEYEPFVRHVYNSMLTKEYYQDYMASGEDSFEEDCRLFSCIFEDEFEDNEELDSILEDMSLLWVDDLAYALNVIIAGIDETRRKKRIVHPNTFLKEDDKEFALRLLTESILRYEEYFKLLEGHLDNWNSDRLVSTDATLIVMGVTEAVVFPTIPIKVTINEYVEIAKYYSTPNSRIFVNGILDRIIQEKVGSGEIVKQGRGLFEQ
jgi:N utilization substance protein B